MRREFNIKRVFACNWSDTKVQKLNTLYYADFKPEKVVHALEAWTTEEVKQAHYSRP